MKKRKIISFVLLGVMCLSCLAGCGKTEEEKAIEELQENVAQDDKSLDDYLNDVDEFVANREEMDDLINTEYLPEIQSTWENYLASQTVEEAKENAEAFNNAYDKLMELKDQEYTSEYELINAVSKAISGGSRVDDWEFTALDVFGEKVLNAGYDVNEFCFDDETLDFMFYCHNENEINGIVVKSDGSECTVNIDPATEFPGNTGVNFYEIDNEVIVIRTTDEAYNEYFYTMDITGDTACNLTQFEYNYEEYYDRSYVNKTVDALISVLNSMIIM